MGKRYFSSKQGAPQPLRWTTELIGRWKEKKGKRGSPLASQRDGRYSKDPIRIESREGTTPNSQRHEGERKEEGEEKRDLNNSPRPAAPFCRSDLCVYTADTDYRAKGGKKRKGGKEEKGKRMKDAKSFAAPNFCPLFRLISTYHSSPKRKKKGKRKRREIKRKPSPWLPTIALLMRMAFSCSTSFLRKGGGGGGREEEKRKMMG